MVQTRGHCLESREYKIILLISHSAIVSSLLPGYYEQINNLVSYDGPSHRTSSPCTLMITGKVRMVGAFPWQRLSLYLGAKTWKVKVCFWNMLLKLGGLGTFRVQCKTPVFMCFFDSDDKTRLNETCLGLHW